MSPLQPGGPPRHLLALLPHLFGHFGLQLHSLDKICALPGPYFYLQAKCLALEDWHSTHWAFPGSQVPGTKVFVHSKGHSSMVTHGTGGGSTLPLCLGSPSSTLLLHRDPWTLPRPTKHRPPRSEPTGSVPSAGTLDLLAPSSLTSFSDGRGPNTWTSCRFTRWGFSGDWSNDPYAGATRESIEHLLSGLPLRNALVLGGDWKTTLRCVSPT